jgi:hypothetical protein
MFCLNTSLDMSNNLNLHHIEIAMRAGLQHTSPIALLYIMQMQMPDRHMQKRVAVTSAAVASRHTSTPVEAHSSQGAAYLSHSSSVSCRWRLVMCRNVWH